MSLQVWLEVRPAGVRHDVQISLIRWVCIAVTLDWQHVTAVCMFFLLIYLANAMLSICLIHLCHLKQKKNFLFLSRGTFIASRTILWREIHFVILFPLTRPFVSHSTVLWQLYAQAVHDFACVYTSVLQHCSPLPVNQCLLSASCPLAFCPWVPVELCPNCWKELCCKKEQGKAKSGTRWVPASGTIKVLV